MKEYTPYARNPYFTGRESLLAELEQRFFSRDQNSSRTIRRTALTQPQALKGLGGIGKTQIAIEYADCSTWNPGDELS